MHSLGDAMKKLLIAGAALTTLIGTHALAADMPLKAPPPPAPVWSWTGFYVGGNVGYGWGTARNDPSFSQTDTFPSTNLAIFAATDSAKLNGVNGGLQAGFNWQVSNYLYGIETDFQGSGQRGSDTFNSVIQNLSVGGVGNNPATVTDTDKLRWFGTTRGRVGLVMDRWLVYGTGGVAYGNVNQSGNVQPANSLSGGFNTNAPIVWNQSTTRVGWTAGVGVENAITQNWSWKVEYLYVDLGTATANLSGGIGTTIGLPYNCYGPTGGGICNNFHNPASGTITSHFTDNIVRVGLNYKFNTGLPH